MATKFDSGFEVLRVSDLNFEGMTTEIQFQGEQVAQVNIDKGAGHPEIELYTKFVEKGFKPVFSLKDFREALDEALSLLTE